MAKKLFGKIQQPDSGEPVSNGASTDAISAVTMDVGRRRLIQQLAAGGVLGIAGIGTMGSASARLSSGLSAGTSQNSATYSRSEGFDETQMFTRPANTFGRAVALDETTLVVGYGEFEGGLERTAYVFERGSCGEWVMQQTVSPSIGFPDVAEGFGKSIVVEGDWMIIGAPEARVMRGTAFVFHRSTDGIWRERQSIAFYDPDGGLTTSIAFDGETAAFGGPIKTEDYPGRVRIYQREGDGTFVEKQLLKSPEQSESNFDGFGRSAAIDDGTLVVGAFSYRNDEGAAYSFDQDSNGDWTRPQQISTRDEVGETIDLDGNVAVLGAPFEVAETPNYAGAAYVYERGPAGEWVETQRLTGPEPESYDLFGWAVTIDEETILVSAPCGSRPPDQSRPRTIYVYEREGDGTWRLQQALTLTEQIRRQRFGHTLALHDETLVAGAPSIVPFNDGSAYVFER
ncbi:hypothetical protein [Haloarchaeobius sp. TZWWS8]|uniref:FG-GAP repeat protein n=1 Tax=Haloarchaeobius sp. TZWWS8 TaxID=3446121 RepID=UPI003EBEB559